jgi:hypothetical protein
MPKKNPEENSDFTPNEGPEPAKDADVAEEGSGAHAPAETAPLEVAPEPVVVGIKLAPSSPAPLPEPFVVFVPPPGFVPVIYSGPAHFFKPSFDGQEYTLQKGVAAYVPEGLYQDLKTNPLKYEYRELVRRTDEADEE